MQTAKAAIVIQNALPAAAKVEFARLAAIIARAAMSMPNANVIALQASMYILPLLPAVATAVFPL